MLCPYCGGEAAVLDSRNNAEGVRRRRSCQECKRRFTTYERVASPSIKVLKRSGKQEAFAIEKIARCILRVSRDRKQIGSNEANEIGRSVEAYLLDGGAKGIASSSIASLVLEKLKTVDRISFDRLAANYIDESGLLRTEGNASSDSSQLKLFKKKEEES